MLEILQAATSAQIVSARKLFREYEKWLGMDLCFQGFEAEMASLPGRYAKPSGRLLLGLHDENIAGCVALRKIEDGICEMKRLYVREDFRGLSIGIGLIEYVIDEAKTTGYSTMRLDTYPPKMGKAVKLYESHGFRLIPPYHDNPFDGVLFMECDL
ncbi:MAG: GNAT family N-acetyltransferase, partial [Pyrinomonadaceae bacterium]